MLHNAAQEPHSVLSTIYRMGNIGPPVHDTFLPSDSTDLTTPERGTSLRHSHLAPFDMQAAMVAVSVALGQYPATTPEWRVVWVPVDHIAAKIVACVETQRGSNVPEGERAGSPSIVHVAGSAASEQVCFCVEMDFVVVLAWQRNWRRNRDATLLTQSTSEWYASSADA